MKKTVYFDRTSCGHSDHCYSCVHAAACLAAGPGAGQEYDNNMREINNTIFNYADEQKGYAPSGAHTSNFLFNGSEVGKGTLLNYLPYQEFFDTAKNKIRRIPPKIAYCPGGRRDWTVPDNSLWANDGNPNFSYGMNYFTSYIANKPATLVNFQKFTSGKHLSTRMSLAELGKPWLTWYSGPSKFVGGGGVSSLSHIAYRHPFLKSTNIVYADGHAAPLKAYALTRNVSGYDGTEDVTYFWRDNY